MFKRKYKRTFKGRRKIRRRFKKKRAIKRFNRLLNTVAEKKTIYFTCPNSSDTHAHTLSSDNTTGLAGIFSWLFTNLAQGTSRSQRVGSKIFIRHIIIKGTFYNNVGTAGATGKVGFWLGREKSPGSLLAKTRSAVIGTVPDALIPDFSVVGYQWVRKKTGFITYYAPGAVNNTPTIMGNSLGYEFNFSIKIRLFKTMEFQTAAYKIGDGLYDFVPIPYIDSGAYNLVGTGMNNTINVRVTYTDV